MGNKTFTYCLVILVCLGLVSCTTKMKNKVSLFTLIPPSESGITFANNLHSTKELNTYTFRNFYDGGGVALADINNDGLLDIYFTGNTVGNRLYLNKGHFHFEDITKESGVGCDSLWSTGATFADINGDGLPDLFVCISGPPGGKDRHNKLFINNGDLTFTEESATYGLNHSGLSMQASFFDYDHDGDLDLYLLNNSIRSVVNFSEKTGAQRKTPDPLGGNKLYRNDHGHFTDVTAKAGIYSSIIGFGLGVSVGDLNRDGWPDIYISNDFFERDYLYLNNQDGTFREVLPKEVRETSLSAMGADIADINNDGYPDIFVTDMLPENESRYRTKTIIQSWREYNKNIRNGYYHQFTRNTLQLNNGDGTYSEIGRLAGVEATDWSWGALMFDMDNDGYNDIFVANGIYRDLLDQDYIHNMSNPRAMNSILKDRGSSILKLISLMPSDAISNYAFHHGGGLTFADSAGSWGLGQASFSNGAAYGDLNNDGALDLVVNNVNMPAFIYRNNADSLRRNSHWLTVSLKGSGANTGGIGAELTGWAGGDQYYREQMPTRGFESSVDPRVHFGLGTHDRLDSLQVRWSRKPSGRVSFLRDVKAGQIITIRQSDAEERAAWGPKRDETDHEKPVLREVAGPGWRHREDTFNDFERDRLLFHMRSTEGPKLCSGDLNGDGLPDFYVGGAKGQAGALFVQEKNGRFRKLSEPALQADKLSEDIGCAFLDADGDGDQDLYVASGSDEFPASSQALGDRLYLNQGRGRLRRSPQPLPTNRYVASSVVRAVDYDGDGNMDLFVGERLRPFAYGMPTGGFLLKGDGKGHFRDVTGQAAPGLAKAGMITDGLWSDIDGDGRPDLIVVGEWMPIRIWHNQGDGTFREITKEEGLTQTSGWWNAIAEGDLNGDGRPDYVVGNLGLNSELRASPARPMRMYVSDFDGNGLIEQVITTYKGKKAYPLALRHDLLAQLPGLKDKYPTYASYKDQTIGDIFTAEQLKEATVDSALSLSSVALLSGPDGKYKVVALPTRAQFSPVYGILVRDLDGDGKADVLLGGNLYGVKPQLGRYDASWGLMLKGDGKGGLRPVPSAKSGFRVRGQIRDIMALAGSGDSSHIIVSINDDSLRMFEY